MKRAILYCYLLVPTLALCQSTIDDQVTFRAALDWLDRKLNYYYYDETAQKWWLNRFYVNEQKEVTIKNIATDKPQSANIKEKVYLIRKFRIQDINPYSMEIRDITTSQGRIARGKLLEIRTFSNQKKIHKTVDGRRATTTSFVHISFPTFMTDSIANYANLVKGKLAEAIVASTKVYASGNVIEDKNTILKIMEGTFSAKDGATFTGVKRYKNTLRLSFDEQSEQFFGYDLKERLFYLIKINNEGTKTAYYELVGGEKLILRNTSTPDDMITFETLNTVRLMDTQYYRQ